MQSKARNDGGICFIKQNTLKKSIAPQKKI
jgi:hypothetical protein